MASSMDTNVSLGQGAGIRAVEGVKGRPFALKRHRPSKKQKRRKKEKRKLSDSHGHPGQNQKGHGDLGNGKGKRGRAKPSGTLVDVVI